RRGGDLEDIELAQGLVALRIPALPQWYRSLAGAGQLEAVRNAGRAQVLIAQSKAREALAVYRELIGRSPSFPNLHLSHAALLLQLQDPKAAEAELREELKVNPASVEARLRLCALLGDDSPEEMVALAEEAVKLDPGSFKAHFYLGKLLYKVDQLERSARELETSRELDPSSSMVRFALVRTYKSLGREADAQRESAVFARLREAEDSFRKSGRLPAWYFEPGGPGAAASPHPRPAQVPAAQGGPR
ncbi:MAG TPA: tetratricopeptide repeat protein, partial [Bryobacteraceae bacterium]|nr:tetratricopeptide repeat protein [Bryobacteraceae bacterium]